MIQTSSDLLQVYSTDLWGRVAANPERAYLGGSPTLCQLQARLGAKAVTTWIEAQLTAIFGASSSTDASKADAIPFFAANFAPRMRGYKVSELMLFFSRYATGMYSESYAAFDLRQLGAAFQRFVKHRAEELGILERKRAQQEIQERAFTPPDGYTSLTWHQHMERERRKTTNNG